MFTVKEILLDSSCHTTWMFYSHFVDVIYKTAISSCLCQTIKTTIMQETCKSKTKSDVPLLVDTE